MTHTSGPWTISGQLIVGAPEAFPNPKADPRGKCVATVCWDYEGDRGATEPRITWNEARSNIHLIAAAPELLSIVLDILPDDHNDYSDGIHCDECGTRKSRPDQTECDVEGCWYVRIRSVIAKAKGGEV